VIAESSPLMTESDDGVTIPPDFDSTDASVPVREVESPVDDPFRTSMVDDDEKSHFYEWMPFYIGFGFCSLLALACYRRGAT